MRLPSAIQKAGGSSQLSDAPLAFHDGVRFEKIFLGDPREWQRRGPVPNTVHTIHPADDLRRRSSVNG
ncbi:hypothetical protein ACQP0U_17510 [Micromonospora sp. CA-269861]|uniref:hypothetical protein n=1 Tax=Micromonospora sp. CA-269861 TaxID=3239968 RepID=UPI003D89D63F